MAAPINKSGTVTPHDGATPAMLLRTERLTKDYGTFRALDRLDLTLQPGEETADRPHREVWEIVECADVDAALARLTGDRR